MMIAAYFGCNQRDLRRAVIAYGHDAVLDRSEHQARQAAG
jgi:hypothetical protein